MNLSKLEASTCNRCEARETCASHGTIGFGFFSEWLSRAQEVSEPITERCETKRKQFRTIFDAYSKIALLPVVIIVIIAYYSFNNPLHFSVLLTFVECKSILLV